MSEEFLKAYSPGWGVKDREIDAQVVQISDPDLKKAQRMKLWGEVELQPFRTEADKSYKLASTEYGSKRSSFFEAHMDQWFEVAQYADYAIYNQIVEFSKSSESPFIIENLKMKVDIPVMDSVFINFRTTEKTNINAAVEAEWQQLTFFADPNKFYAGLPQSEVNAMVSEEKKKIWDQQEQKLRRSRLVLVAQGNVNKKEIRRLAFMNQLNEDILYEFPEKVIGSITSLLQ